MAVKQIDYRNVLGDPLERGVVIDAIERDAETYRIFQKLSEVLQEELIAFCMGNWGLKITYDPFFKYVFNPELKPERLSDLFYLLKKYNLEPKKLRLVHSYYDSKPKLILIKATKNAKSFLNIDEPLIIYNKDGSYTDEILKIYNKEK